MYNYFEILESENLIKRNKPNVEKIYALSIKKIESIAARLGEAQVPLNQTSPINISHCASLNMSGDAFECFEIGCRSRRLDELGRFSVLYSSRVYINNFFDSFMHSRGDEDHLKYLFLGNVSLSLQIRRLLESGIVSFSPINGMACPDCLAKIINGKNAKKKETDRAIAAISKELFRNIELIPKLSPHPILEVNFKEPYSECGRIQTFEKIPNMLKPYFKVAGNKLPNKIAKRMGYHESRAIRTFTNVSFELTLSDQLGANVLFDDPLHVSFINKIARDHEVERKNSIALKHMTTLMPFADKVPVNKILELRENEPESFYEFQKAFLKGIEEVKKSKKFNDSDAHAMYRDIIQPKLNKLDLTFKNAQRSLIKNIYRNAIAAVGSLSVGVLSGAITNGFVPALAGAIFAQKAIKSVMEIKDESDELRNDKFYFLWKVKRTVGGR